MHVSLCPTMTLKDEGHEGGVKVMHTEALLMYEPKIAAVRFSPCLPDRHGSYDVKLTLTNR